MKCPVSMSYCYSVDRLSVSDDAAIQVFIDLCNMLSKQDREYVLSSYNNCGMHIIKLKTEYETWTEICRPYFLKNGCPANMLDITS